MRSLPTPARQIKSRRGIERDLLALEGTPEDRTKRVEVVEDARRSEALGDERVGERLHVAALDVRQPHRAELGQHPQPECALVAPDRRRPVGLALAAPDRAVAHAGEKDLGCPA